MFPLRLLAARSGSSVLIAGGGFAGLYAADILKRAGFRVRLLEASSRLGGRALGGTVAGSPYDFGCQAFGKDMTRVQALGKRYGLTVAPRPKQGAFFLRNDDVIVGDALEVLHKDFDAIEALGQSQYSQCDDPALRPGLAAQNVMDWARPHLSQDTVEYFRSAFASEWCDIPDNVSLLHYLEYQRGYDAEGEEMDFRFREGLYNVAEGLARDLGDAATTRCPLESVDVQDRIVRVRAGGRDFEADFLVLALPLTKLKAIPIRGVDTTALSGSLESVIGAQVRKVLAVYDRPFWGTLPTEGAMNLPLGMTMMDNSDMAGQRYSLAIFLGGPAAVENPGRDQVLARVAKVLGPEALSPVDYHEQAWLGDEFLCGGYAANRMPTRGSSAAIPSSLGSRVYVACSEASREFPSYVEGALYSAELAASSISKVRH